MRTHLDITHEGTLGDDDRTRMTFDENSIAHLMSVLTDLYSNPTLAVIREYSTNAWDSHRAAGINDPIEVTLPTKLTPTFTVRDHGIGMSVDDINNNFSKYGWSSKRDNDDEVGMLGLGCKSGLTYTSQFTLVAVKNGVQTTVLVTREGDGAGTIQIMDTTSTDEPNGVEVSIPVSYVMGFVSEAHRFYKFWQRGTVLVDGEEPTPWAETEDVLQLDPDVLLVPNQGQDYLVMGNVAYPVPTSEESLVLSNTYSAVCYVPIGAINFTPSREALHMTKRTKEVVNDSREFISSHFKRLAQAAVDDAKTHYEALRVARQWRSGFFFGQVRELTYRGQDVPWTFKIPEDGRGMRWGVGNPQGSRVRDINSSDLNENAATRLLLVHGHTPISLSQQTKARINKYIAQRGLATKVVYCSTDRIGAPWLNDIPRVSYDELKKIDLPEFVQIDSTGKPRAKYKIIGTNGHTDYVDDLESTVYYVLTTDKRFSARGYTAYNRADLRSFFRLHYNDTKVSLVLLSEKQVKKFVADNPGALPISAFFKKKLAAVAASMTQTDLVCLSDTSTLNSSRLATFRKMSHQFLDSELRAVIDLAGNCLYTVHGGNTDTWRALKGWAERLDITVPQLPKPNDVTKRVRAVMKKYPLLQTAREYGYGDFPSDLSDYVEYANAVFFNRLIQPYDY